ncbi:medium chain dehydrogenase/reductase family protein [Candidatus Binatia bacterium]|nr:medium chain dehydrogenase/reductase family protein [Candidatus Binatia bacterium]
MRQVWITKVGAPDVLQVREAPDPQPGPGEVRIRVEASGVNFADISARLGFYPDAPKVPCVVGYEVAGRIDAVGAGVAEARIDEDVLGLTRFGGYSDVVVVPDGQATRRPAGLDAQTAAAIPVTYLTAYQMLIEMGRVRPGDRVLIHQAAGGVGLAAIDLCALTGNVETFGTASASKHDFVRARGLTHPIDYHTRDYEQEVRRLTGGRGVDLILDPIGGDSWRKGLRLLAPTGRLLCFGMSSANQTMDRSILAGLKAIASIPWLKVNPITLMNENKGVFGVNLGRMWDEAERLSGWLERILGWWAEGKVRPHVDRAFPFAEAAAAHTYIQERRNVGKVLLVP